MMKADIQAEMYVLYIAQAALKYFYKKVQVFIQFRYALLPHTHTLAYYKSTLWWKYIFLHNFSWIIHHVSDNRNKQGAYIENLSLIWFTCQEAAWIYLFLDHNLEQK